MPFFHVDPAHLLALLHELEWIVTHDDVLWVEVWRCHICGGCEPHHTEACRLAALLTSLRHDLAQVQAIQER